MGFLFFSTIFTLILSISAHATPGCTIYAVDIGHSHLMKSFPSPDCKTGYVRCENYIKDLPELYQSSCQKFQRWPHSAWCVYQLVKWDGTRSKKSGKLGYGPSPQSAEDAACRLAEFWCHQSSKAGQFHACEKL